MGSRPCGSQTTERDLLERVAGGDAGAFAELARRFGARMLTVAEDIAPSDAEDVVQEALIDAGQAIAGGERPRNLGRWLGGLTRYRALGASGQARSAEVPPAPVRVERSTEEIVLERERARETLEEVARLPGNEKAVLVGDVLEGKPNKQIAAELGISENVVSIAKHRGRQRLKALRGLGALVPWPLVELLRHSGRRVRELSAGGGAATGAAATAAAAALAIGAVAMGGGRDGDEGAAAGATIDSVPADPGGLPQASGDLGSASEAHSDRRLAPHRGGKRGGRLGAGRSGRGSPEAQPAPLDLLESPPGWDPPPPQPVEQAEPPDMPGSPPEQLPPGEPLPPSPVEDACSSEPVVELAGVHVGIEAEALERGELPVEICLTG